MLHHSVLKHPFIDNPILLVYYKINIYYFKKCALEIEPETLIFIWKCLIIGSNVDYNLLIKFKNIIRL